MTSHEINLALQCARARDALNEAVGSLPDDEREGMMACLAQSAAHLADLAVDDFEYRKTKAEGGDTK